jgi:WhiB family redox-sensing transcriptional regulator
MHQPTDPNWRDEALCAQVDAAIFFPEVGANATPARRVCAVCPVRAACLADALAHRDLTYGVRGGMTPAERRNHAHTLDTQARSGRWRVA